MKFHLLRPCLQRQVVAPESGSPPDAESLGEGSEVCEGKDSEACSCGSDDCCSIRGENVDEEVKEDLLVLEEQPEEPPPQPRVVLENAVDTFSSRRGLGSRGFGRVPNLQFISNFKGPSHLSLKKKKPPSHRADKSLSFFEEWA